MLQNSRTTSRVLQQLTSAAMIILRSSSRVLQHRYLRRQFASFAALNRSRSSQDLRTSALPYKKDPKTSRFFFIHTSISLIIEVKNVAIGSKIFFFKSIFKTIQSLARDKHITAKNNISPELVKFSRALVARSSPVAPKFFREFGVF